MLFRSMQTVAGSVHALKVANRKAQSNYLLEIAKNCVQETAVLYRNHECALPLIDLLDRFRIPYRMKQSDSTFFSHPVIQDILDFIRLAKDPHDGEVFLRIYYKMGAGISKSIATTVVENHRRKNTLLQEVAKEKGISSFTNKQCTTLEIGRAHV